MSGPLPDGRGSKGAGRLPFYFTASVTLACEFTPPTAI